MPQARRPLLTITTVCLIAATAFAGERRRAVPSVGTHFCDFGADVPGTSVPPEFCLRKFADVQTARVLLFAPNGDLFVSSPKRVTPGGAPPGAGAIFLLRESGAGASPARFTFAEGPAFSTVHGLLIANSFFYYTVEDATYRVPFTPGATTIDTSTPEMVASFYAPQIYTRFTHSLALGADGTLYASRGLFDDLHCPPEDDRLGSVLRIGPGHNILGDIVINGLRNPLFIRCMPWGSCYAAELSGDTWGAQGGTEKLIELHDGDNFGYPCCVKKGVPNADIAMQRDCSYLAEPKHTFLLHDTPFGFDWERDFGWPDAYKSAFFVGLHGDYGSWAHAGLQWAPTDPDTHMPARDTVDFITGVGRGKTISRVADVRFAPDGRLFFSDDQDGAIYWIAPRSLLVPRR
jgi:glucose/arabinose dehydrogenase